MSRLPRSRASALLLALVACAPERHLAAPEEPSPRPSARAAPAPLVTLARLAIPTYEGSGQAVHPDVLHFPTGWRGWEYWMAFTPYPHGDAEYENPSLVVSHDGIHWEVPEGLVNPLRPTPLHGINSDPDLSWDAATDQLVLLYREVSGGYNRLRSITSPDGIRWSEPRLLLEGKNHHLVSPTAAPRPGRDTFLWFVDAGEAASCSKRITRVSSIRNSASVREALHPARPAAGWRGYRFSDLVQPGSMIWHLDVIWVPERREYWAVYPAWPGTTCRNEELFFARSRDGISWRTYRVPFIRRGDASWTGGRLYRTSVLYLAARNAIRFYVSAAEAGPGTDWHIGMVEYHLPDFLAALARGVPDPPGAPAPSAPSTADRGP